MQREALKAQTSVQEQQGLPPTRGAAGAWDSRWRVLIAFADNGLGGFSWISTFSWLASSLRGSAGRCYKRFINEMKSNARKSYCCRMCFPSHMCTG